MWKKTRGLLLLTFCQSMAAFAVEAPQYSIEDCCAICPAAADPASYNTSFLRPFITLRQGEDGWMFRSQEEYTTSFGPSDVRYSDLERFNNALRNKGVTLVLIYIPTRGMVHFDKLTPAEAKQFNVVEARHNYKLTLDKFRRHGIVTPDLSQIFERNRDNFFFKRDHHWTPVGARMTAEIVAEEIKKHPVYQQLQQTSFTTRQDGIIRKTGTFQMAVERICHFGAGDQVVPAYITEAEAGSAALFGDTLPEITLVGTSNSNSAVNYNFDGFLKQNLQADIANEAMAGAGYDGALIQYLPSDAFQKTPPKLLLWEVPSYLPLESSFFYRQVVPLVDNGCHDKKVIFQNEVTITEETTEVLFNGGGNVLDISGGRHVVDLQFSDANVKELRSTAWYINGRKDGFKAELPQRVNNNGRFVFELRRDQPWVDMKFLSLDITRLESYKPNLKVKATLCEVP